jgi:integrase
LENLRRVLFKGRWYATWREDGATRRRALRTADAAAADRQLAAFRAAAAAQPTHSTVATIFAAYMADKGKARARDAWRRLAPRFEALTPAQVTRQACRDYIAARRRDGVSDGTTATELTFLRAALRWAGAMPPAVVEMPPRPPPRDRYLTRAEYERLLAECETPHLKLFVVLALATAARREALLQLTWDRVDFERGLIGLGTGEARRKGRATVPMTGPARQALELAHQARTSPTVIEYGGEGVATVRMALKRAAARAGVPWVTPHVFRHTAAVWMAEAGVPMPEIAAYLGHSDSRTTERVYAKFSPAYLRKASLALE